MTPLDRAAVFRGEIATLPRCAASTALADRARAHASAAFERPPSELPALHAAFAADESWDRTCRARASLASDVAAREACVALAIALGFDADALACDAPRLRVVTPGAHARAAALRAFYMHRDTWYGSPRAQVNVWIPLFDVDERDSFAIHAAAFGVAVDNDSDAFDYARFVSRGGFQSAATIDAAYPRCLVASPGAPTCVVARADDVLVFSAAHLHGTTPNDTARTRLSVDVRFVDVRDVERGLGAPDVDNRSRGSALVDYARGAR